MFESLKAGQKVVCTITKDPRGDARDTVMRLMRFDPDHKRALKKAHEHRIKTMYIRSRGGRPWAVRQHPSKIVIPNKGETWNMTWFPHIAPDFKSVASCVEVKPA